MKRFISWFIKTPSWKQAVIYSLVMVSPGVAVMSKLAPEYIGMFAWLYFGCIPFFFVVSLVGILIQLYPVVVSKAALDTLKSDFDFLCRVAVDNKLSPHWTVVEERLDRWNESRSYFHSQLRWVALAAGPMGWAVLIIDRSREDALEVYAKYYINYQKLADRLEEEQES